jgi:hypothetical protein
VRERAEALPAGLGLFRVITFGASFHWMDRPCVARAVRTMLTPGGAVVQVDAPGYRPARTVVPDGREIDLSVDQIVAGRFSNSGTAPRLFGERIGEFESDLRSLLADTSSLGWFSVRLPDNILRIWRPA